MNNKIKLIIFFSIIAIIIFILGIVWARKGGGKIEASAENIKTITGNEIVLTLDDYLDSAGQGSTSIYTLNVANNSRQGLENLRIFGYVGLPTKGDLNPVARVLPDWLIPQAARDYSESYYFNYIIDLAGRSKATARIPTKIKKFSGNQNKIYAKASIQALTVNKSFWNIFSLGGGYSGPIIASVEDINTLD